MARSLPPPAPRFTSASVPPQSRWTGRTAGSTAAPAVSPSSSSVCSSQYALHLLHVRGHCISQVGRDVRLGHAIDAACDLHGFELLAKIRSLDARGQSTRLIDDASVREIRGDGIAKRGGIDGKGPLQCSERPRRKRLPSPRTRWECCWPVASPPVSVVSAAGRRKSRQRWRAGGQSCPARRGFAGWAPVFPSPECQVLGFRDPFRGHTR